MRIPSANPQAIACVRGGMGAPKLRGTVRFYAIPGGTLVTAEVSGLPENDTGFSPFTSTRAAVAAERTFRIPEDIIIRTPGSIPVTRETCRRCSAWPGGRSSRWRRADSRPARWLGGRWSFTEARTIFTPNRRETRAKNRLRRDTAGVMRGFFGK